MLVGAAWQSSEASGGTDLTGYTLVFEETFDTLSIVAGDGPLGTKRWVTFPPYGGSGAFSASTWSSDAVTLKVVGGVLIDTTWWDEPLDGWRGGLLASADKFGSGFIMPSLGGYFVARIKMPDAGTGAWPAFWLMSSNSIPDNTGNRLEVDIVEWYGKDHFAAGEAGQTVHYWNGDGSQHADSIGAWGEIPGGDAINTWHEYAVDIRPDFITFYIDGSQTNQFPTNVAYLTSPMYIIINYAIGGGWPVEGDPYDVHGPSSMQVDWVRAYTLPTYGLSQNLSNPITLGETLNKQLTPPPTLSRSFANPITMAETVNKHVAAAPPPDPTLPLGWRKITNLQVVSSGGGMITLTWSAPPGAVLHTIYSRTTPPGETLPATAPLARRAHSQSSPASISAVQVGHTYYFEVRAINTQGLVTPPSNRVSVTYTP